MNNSSINADNKNVSSSLVNEFGESDQIYVYTVWVTSIQQILSLIGIAMNGTLVYITVKHKSLYRSYGFLLAICSLCDALTELGTPLATILVFLRQRIPLLTCLYTQFFGVIATLNSTINLFLISLDRIFSVAFPVFYRNISKSSGKYVLIGNLPSLSICFYGLYLAFAFAQQHPEMMVYCEPGDPFQGNAYFFASFLVMIFTLITGILYIIMWIMLKYNQKYGNTGNTSSQSQREITRRIFKSLAVIMAVIFCLWFLSALLGAMVVPRLFSTDQPLQFLFTRLSAQLITIAGAINAPVLYFCSSEYREILNREFRWVKLLCSMRIQISFSQPNTIIIKNTPNNIAVVRMAPKNQQSTKLDSHQNPKTLSNNSQQNIPVVSIGTKQQQQQQQSIKINANRVHH